MRLVVEPGDPGAARATVAGQGSSLSVPDLPLETPLVVQLAGSHGTCWEVTYERDHVQRNDGERFRAFRRAAP